LSNFDDGFGFMNVFMVIFVILFVCFLIVFIVIAMSNAKRWHKNNLSPVLTVKAKVVSKREDVSGSHNNTNNFNSTSTTYYATFEVESGDRMELAMYGTDYGQLAEGDSGKLTFQGTRYKGFERIC